LTSTAKSSKPAGSLSVNQRLSAVCLLCVLDLQQHANNVAFARRLRAAREDPELAAARVDRIRYASPGRVPAAVFAAVAETGFYIARDPVLAEGRLELLHYLVNQSICDTYHRYGNLGERALS